MRRPDWREALADLLPGGKGVGSVVVSMVAIVSAVGVRSQTRGGAASSGYIDPALLSMWARDNGWATVRFLPGRDAIEFSR